MTIKEKVELEIKTSGPCYYAAGTPEHEAALELAAEGKVTLTAGMFHWND